MTINLPAFDASADNLQGVFVPLMAIISLGILQGVTRRLDLDKQLANFIHWLCALAMGIAACVATAYIAKGLGS